MLNIPQKTEYVLNRLNENGFEAYIVGGCVRDMLMGIVPHDFDITTSATPEEVTEIFEKTVPTGIKHGTVTVLVDKTPIEVTTFRTESGYSNHRSPDEVKFVRNLKEDLSRRDFTVNAMAYNHQSGVIDYFGGKEDLENKILRAVGSPRQRFSEDALRILRLFRFASVLGFSIEENTLKGALEEKSGLELISRERIASELNKAVKGKNIEALSPLISSGGLSFIGIKNEPDYKKMKGCNDRLSLFLFLYLAECNIFGVLDELKVSKALKNYAFELLDLLLEPPPKTKVDIKKCLYQREIFEDYIFALSVTEDGDYSYLSQMLDEIFENNEPFRFDHLKINGNDLIERGYENLKIGKILSDLLLLVINDPSQNTKENLIKNLP